VLTRVPGPLAVLGWTATLLLCVLQLRARRRLADVARVCHEVRGPLCAARLGLDTLRAEPARLTAIDLELRRAARALEDLGGDAPADRRELVDVCALARAHAPAWQAVAAAHAAELRLDVITEVAPAAVVPLRPRRGVSSGPLGSTTVFADPVRLAQACANLVANAAEHGGGVVRVRVAAVGDRVRFEVADDGPGLPAPVAALAGRARNGRRGHGLAVAAAVAARHGGRLTAAPARSGARLVLALPAAMPAAPARATAPPEIVA
jgi:signal transduction histidine kinase